MSGLCEVYAAGSTMAQPTAVLRDRIVALATAFARLPASEERLEGQVAVSGLDQCILRGPAIEAG